MLNKETIPYDEKLYPTKLFFKREDPQKKCIDAVASDNYLLGLILGMCDKLKQPILFMQRKSSKELQSCPQSSCPGRSGFCDSGKYLRMESSLFYSYWAEYCKKIRTKNNSLSCCKQDEIVADYLLDNRQNLKKEQIIKNHDGTKILIRKIAEDKTGHHTLISYECPMSHYDELAINININGLEGVVVIGQYLFKDTSSNQIERFKAAAQNLISEKEIEEIISRIHCRIQEEKNKIMSVITDLEKELKSSYDSRVYFNLMTVQERIIATFKSSYEAIEKTPVKTFKSAVEFCSDKYLKLKKALGDALVVWVKAIQPKSHFEEAYYALPNGLYYDSDYEIYRYNGNLIEIEESELSTDYEYRKVTTAGVHKLSNNHFVYCAPLDLNEKRYIYIISTELLMDPNIKKLTDYFISYVCLAAAELVAQFNEAQISTYTAIMRHELGQLNEATLLRIQEFENAIIKQESSQGNMAFLDESKYVVDDFKSYAHSTMLRCNSSRYFSLLPMPNFERFYPYEKFLYKWKFIYMNMAKNKQIDFKMNSTNITDLTRPQMFGDISMIEQVAYNLTNNAFKYGLNGTTINFDCRLNDDKTLYQIIVTNYAWIISKEEKERIFDYGYRGNNQNEKEGSGLGLYLSRIIAEIHHGSLQLETQKVSEYDIRCMSLYDDMPERFRNEKIAKSIDMEWERLKETEFFKELKKLQASNTVFTPFYVNRYLNKGTMKYKFIFSIPYQKKNLEG